MSIVLTILGVLLAIGGLTGILLGAPFFALGFDNTLVLSGTMGLSTGAVLIGLGQILRYLARIEARLTEARDESRAAASARRMPEHQAAPERQAASERQVAPDSQVMSERQVAPERVGPDRQTVSEHHVATREVADQPVPDVVEDRGHVYRVPPPAPPPPRVPEPPPQAPLAVARPAVETSLPASPRATPPSVAHPSPEPAAAPTQTPPPPPPPVDPFRAAWQDAWRREWDGGGGGGGTTATPTAKQDLDAPTASVEKPAEMIPPRAAAAAATTADANRVVRSGVIGGMAFSIYADGSIEAELPEGVVRFPDIQALREHVERVEAGTR